MTEAVSKKKLKVGILVQRNEIPLWAFKMLEKIENSDFAEIALVIRKTNRFTPQKNVLKRIWDNKSKYGYVFYRKLEDKLYPSQPDAFQMINWSELFNCPVLDVETKETKFSDRFKEQDLETIQSYDLDVMIRMGFKILRGKILTTTKYGIWSYHHGDNRINRGGPAGVWEVFEQWPQTGVTLQILTEDLDAGKVISRSTSSTHKGSVNKNRNNFYWQASSLLPNKLEELFKTGEKDFFQKIEEQNSGLHFYDRRLYRMPKNGEVLKSIAKLYYKKIKKRIDKRFYRKQWILLFSINKNKELSRSFYRFKELIPPKDRFWADPFPLYKDGFYYIFIEELIFSKKKGHISVIKMDKKGNSDPPKKVLEKDFHLSYPFLFENDGNLYMIPETKKIRCIQLYKCEEFPDKWKLEKVLMDNVPAVDTTILKRDGKFWMFTTFQKEDQILTHDELFVFYSNNLVSDKWIPHKKNPVVSNVKSARPAGSFFTFKNELYRPAQNCQSHYGYGLTMNKVRKINTEEYKEEVVQYIEPKWKKQFLGVHTINHENELTVSDALYKRRK